MAGRRGEGSIEPYRATARTGRRSAAAFSLAVALVVAAVVPGSPSAAMPRPVPAPTTAAGPKLDPSSVAPARVPGEYVVRFRESASAAAKRRALGSALTTPRAVASTPAGTRYALVRIPDAAGATETLARLRAHADIEAVEPNLLRFPVAIPNDPSFVEQWGLNNEGQGHGISGGSQTAQGSSDADIDAVEAWDQQKGDGGTVIAIMDSGTDVAHPDLAPNLWVNPEEIADNNKDDDHNGFVDDIHGWDFAEDDASLLEDDPFIPNADHGTHVAGIAAAAMNDDYGVAGVCPECSLMVLKVGAAIDTDEDGEPDDMGIDIFSELLAYDYAVEHGADIVNLSFGAPLSYSLVERDAIADAGAFGLLTVISAGNDGGDNDEFLQIDLGEPSEGFGPGPDIQSPFHPAAYDATSILSVAASNHRDEYGYSTACAAALGDPAPPCAFTNWGAVSVDLAAPGVDVFSTLPHETFAHFDGTSMAAPHAAGAAGLILSKNPGLSPVQVKNALLNGVDMPASLNTLRPLPGKTVSGRFTGSGGRLNALAAMFESGERAGAAPDSNIRNAKHLPAVGQGTVTWPEDVNDVWKKRLVKGKRYEVAVDGPPKKDLDLWIWKPAATEIWQFEEGCSNRDAGPCRLLAFRAQPGVADETAVIKPRSTGSYYFHVVAYLENAGSYKLTVKAL